MRLRALALKTALLGTAAFIGSPAQAAANCEALPQALALAGIANTSIVAAQSIAAGSYTPPGSGPLNGLPAFCRVQGVVTPVPGSQIGFEVWLPQAAWNAKLQMFGNGGYSSSLDYGSMAQLLGRGYATVGTDTGHTGSDPDFALGHPEAIVDWSWRAVHESIVAAKQVVAAFYGSGPTLNYFSGCSTGGQQAFAAVQRFPADFDGVIAGDPGHNRTHLNAGFLWEYLQDHPFRDDAHPILPASKLSLITQAAVNSCRAQNGTINGGLSTDNFLDDPRDCGFDPAALQCPAGDQPSCLTAPQVQVARAIYAGPSNPRTGHLIENGFTRGSETGWASYFQDFNGLNQPARTNFWKYWAFQNKNWNWWTFDFDAAMKVTDDRIAATVNSMNADIEPFRRRGGKLLQYHGWADPVVPSLESINYYGRVVAAQAAGSGLSTDAATQQTGAFYRLFMVPGLNHCNGGPGPNTFLPNMQAALENWVERGQAPDSVVAARYANSNGTGALQFSRPLCPYPAKARYTGSNPTDAGSFTCVVDQQQHPTPAPAAEYLR